MAVGWWLVAEWWRTRRIVIRRKSSCIVVLAKAHCVRHSRESGNPFARLAVIPAKASVTRHPGEGRDPFCFCLALVCDAAAKTDSRPCGFRPPSWRPSYFLLLAQKKVTKEKGTLASAVPRGACPRDFASR